MRPIVINEEALASAGLIDAKQSHRRAAEELRIVQSKLLRQAFGANSALAASSPSNVILVTSAVPGEGKTFVSINIAAGLARESGRQVILADIDAKPRGLGDLFGRAASPGLLDLVRGLDIADVMVGTAIMNLDVLTLGSAGREGSESLSNMQMVQLLKDLAGRYADRLILLDAPPCLSSSIPHALAELVGQIMFVVAAGTTQQDDVEAALDLLRACPAISLLLNKIPPWNAHSFGLYNYPQGQT
jgi:receptor protein-tyrosine kinase